MKRGYADTAFGQLHYSTEGSGQPLILLGPAWQSSRARAGLSSMLSSRFQVFAMDPLGVGNSDPMPPDATVKSMAEWIVGAADDLDLDRPHIYGLHRGNKIAAALAAHWPSRIGDVVLAGQNHSLIPDQAERNAAVLDIVGSYFDSQFQPDAEMRQILSWTRTYRRVTNIWWNEALFSQPSKETFAAAKDLALDEIQSSDSILATYRAVFAHDFAADLRAISARTLLIELASSAEDRLYGRQSPALRSLMPTASFLTLEMPSGQPITVQQMSGEIAAAVLPFLS